MPSISFHPAPPTPRSALKPGQIWKNLEANEVYILADLNAHYTLVRLSDGCVWSGPCDSIEDVFGHTGMPFALVSQPFTIIP